MILKTKNAQNLETNGKDLRTGSPILTFSINMKEFNISQDKSLSEKTMSFGLETESALKFSLLTGFAKFIAEIEKSDQETDKKFLRTLQSADDCTYVYWGCGSCGEGSCRVDVYCNSSGSGTPDYSYCEVCC